jgi:hypothetical protein
MISKLCIVLLNLSCGGGHLEFMIDTNNEKLANGDRMTIHVQLGCLSFIKFPRLPPPNDKFNIEPSTKNSLKKNLI